MDILLIYSLGEKIADKCGGAASGIFIDFLRSDCFMFIVAVIIASIIEGVGLDFLFTGTGTGTGQTGSGGRNQPSGPVQGHADYAQSHGPEPASTLAEIWGTGGPEGITLQDVVE